MAKLICPNCSTEFNRPDSRVSPGMNFCCMKCRSEFQRKEKTVQCRRCGKDVYKPHLLSRPSEDHYCSRECRKYYIDYTCAYCKTSFSAPRVKPRKYCSKSCKAKGEDTMTTFVNRFLPPVRQRRNGGLIKKYRGIMSNHLGRKLETHEHVHHIDGNIHNNDISNLEIIDKHEHARLHGLMRAGKT